MNDLQIEIEIRLFFDALAEKMTAFYRSRQTARRVRMNRRTARKLAKLGVL